MKTYYADYYFDKITTILFLALFSSLLISCTESSETIPSQNACDQLRLFEDNNSFSNRIIDGTQCPLRGSPVVQISILVEDGNTAICSGTVIAPEYILTAAHCYDEDTTGVILSSSVRIEGVDNEISEVILHPQANIPQNDIAIIKLEEPTAVRPVPLLLSRSMDSGDIISIFGYGFDEEFSFATLRSGEMEVTGITSQDIFARFRPGRGSNVCFGDSGGPALFTLDDGSIGIVGVTSFATSAGCVEDAFAAFANVQGISISEFIFDVVPSTGIL